MRQLSPTGIKKPVRRELSLSTSLPGSVSPNQSKAVLGEQSSNENKALFGQPNVARGTIHYGAVRVGNSSSGFAHQEADSRGRPGSMSIMSPLSQRKAATVNQNRATSLYGATHRPVANLHHHPHPFGSHQNAPAPAAHHSSFSRLPPGTPTAAGDHQRHPHPHHHQHQHHPPQHQHHQHQHHQRGNSAPKSFDSTPRPSVIQFSHHNKPGQTPLPAHSHHKPLSKAHSTSSIKNQQKRGYPFSDNLVAAPDYYGMSARGGALLKPGADELDPHVQSMKRMKSLGADGSQYYTNQMKRFVSDIDAPLSGGGPSVKSQYTDEGPTDLSMKTMREKEAKATSVTAAMVPQEQPLSLVSKPRSGEGNESPAVPSMNGDMPLALVSKPRSRSSSSTPTSRPGSTDSNKAHPSRPGSSDHSQAYIQVGS